jgi:hypothetical protein
VSRCHARRDNAALLQRTRSALISRANNKTKRISFDRTRRTIKETRIEFAASRSIGYRATCFAKSRYHRAAKWRPYRVIPDCPHGPFFMLWRAILQVARAIVCLRPPSSAGRHLLLIERRQVTAQSEFNSSLPTAAPIAPGRFNSC